MTGICILCLGLVVCFAKPTASGTCLDANSEFTIQVSNVKRDVFKSGQSTVSDRFTCANLCYSESNCNSFQYDGKTGSCIRHSVSFEALLDYDATPQDGNVVYCKSGAQTLGTACNSDADCQVTSSFCYQGRCTCVVGYSFNQMDNSCIRSCSAYGPDMTLYPGIGIWGYNTATIHTSLKGCITACVTASYLCLSFDFKIADGTCHLSNAGYLDVPAGNRDTSSASSGWILGTRTCG